MPAAVVLSSPVLPAAGQLELETNGELPPEHKP